MSKGGWGNAFPRKLKAEASNFEANSQAETLTCQAQSAKVLDDESFEHDTQATTGSTTGDWFLMFCSKDKRLACGEETLAKWDELSGSLRGRASVAYIDITTARET